MAFSPPARSMDPSEDLTTFSSLEEYVRVVGGKRVLKKILVASNVYCPMYLLLYEIRIRSFRRCCDFGARE